jgi:hypothetical protein
MESIMTGRDTTGRGRADLHIVDIADYDRVGGALRERDWRS